MGPTRLSSLIITCLLHLTNLSLCTGQQQQYFRVRPPANVEVNEGSLVIIKCEVGNQAGAAQWSKNGFLLGFNRTIPGYPRYTMVNNGREGVHNLRIEGARIEDDGEYQCQVGPGLGSRPIRANSRLSVLLRPRAIDITGHLNGSNAEVRQEEELNLECVVSGGKPAAQIKWFRRGVELKSDHVEVQSTETATSTYTTESDSGSHELTITKSSIKLKPHSSDNGQTYTCQAFHPAITSTMKAVVTLSVLFPPGPPEISGYTTGENVTEGDTMTLVCRSKGGNPLAHLVWFKNNEQVDNSYTTLNGRDSINSHTFIIDSSDNNAVYRCDASSPLMIPSPASTSVELKVHYAASIKKLSELVVLDEGKDAYLECLVDANPIIANMITWRRRNNLTDMLMDNSLGQSGSDYRPSLLQDEDDTKLRTRITMEKNRSFLIIYNVSRQDTGNYDCMAFNGVGERDFATANLVIKHQPMIDRSPILAKEAVSSGETGRLYCRARGAPNVTFSWYREGAVIQPKGSSDSEKYWIEDVQQMDLITYQSVLVINRASSADYGSYKCVARNILGFDTAIVNFSRTLKPDPPLALRVINITSTSVILKWIPGFDGGLPQSFRLRFKTASSTSEPFTYSDVFPSNTTTFELTSLLPSTVYTFAIMAYNSLGGSDFTSDIVKAETLKESPVSETERVISQVLSGKAGDFPKLIIIVVTVIGSSLLLLNIVLVVCFLGKRKKRFEEVWEHLCKLFRNPAEVQSTEPTSSYTTESDSGSHEMTMSKSNIKLTPPTSDNSQLYNCQTFATSSYTTESDSSSHEMTMTKTNIKLIPPNSDNGQIFTCQGYHPEIFTPMPPMPRSLDHGRNYHQTIISNMPPMTQLPHIQDSGQIYTCQGYLPNHLPNLDEISSYNESCYM